MFLQMLLLNDVSMYYARTTCPRKHPGGGTPIYITDGETRRNFQKKPLNVTILGVAPANVIP